MEWLITTIRISLDLTITTRYSINKNLGDFMKNCIDCGMDKDESLFSKDKNRKDGLCVYCRKCSRTQKNNYYRARYGIKYPFKTRRNLSAKDRFLSGFKKEENGCWIWGGSSRGSNSYGAIMVDGKNIGVHRYSYEFFKDSIPDGMLVLHRCDTPKCINPDHLFLGTQQDNRDDCLKKGRQSKGKKHSEIMKKVSNNGERNHNSKLTDKQRKEIIELDLPQRAIAKIYNVTQTNIWRIKKNARI